MILLLLDVIPGLLRRGILPTPDTEPRRLGRDFVHVLVAESVMVFLRLILRLPVLGASSAVFAASRLWFT